MNDQGAGGKRDASAVEHDLVPGHTTDVAVTNDSTDRAEQLELPRAQGRNLGHRRPDVAIDPQHHTGGFEAEEDLIERL